MPTPDNHNNARAVTYSSILYADICCMNHIDMPHLTAEAIRIHRCHTSGQGFGCDLRAGNFEDSRSSRAPSPIFPGGSSAPHVVAGNHYFYGPPGDVCWFIMVYNLHLFEVVRCDYHKPYSEPSCFAPTLADLATLWPHLASGVRNVAVCRNDLAGNTARPCAPKCCWILENPDMDGQTNLRICVGYFPAR